LKDIVDMAAKKYLALLAGVITEVAAILTSAGAGDEGKIPGLDATGRLDTSFMPVGIGAATETIAASEALSAGDLVNIWNSTGTPKVRKADASAAGKEANGFVLAAVDNGANATVYPPGALNTQLTSLTSVQYYLSATPGAITPTPPSTAGQVVQRVGKPGSDTAMVFLPGEPITLA
jgi:hypothetical protein